MRLIASILIVTLCSTTTAYGADHSLAEKVDRTFTARGDVTGEGQKQTLIIHITGETINSPFIWELSVLSSAGKTIYSVKRNDAWLDKFFNDDGYVTNCAGYVSCKEKYYFTDLPEEIFASLKPRRESWEMDEFRLRNLKDTAGSYLKKLGMDKAKLTEVISEMKNTLSTPPYYVLDVPYSAVQSEPPMIWVKGINRFVPYYQE